MRSRLSIFTSLLALAVAGGVTGQVQAQEKEQEGLVNVAVGDIDALNEIGVLEGTSVQVPIGIAAQVCDVEANVIAEQGDDALTDCTVTQEQATQAFIEFVRQDQASGGDGGEGGEGTTEQEGLVNVAVGDVSALNDVGIANGSTVQVPVGIAAQVCDVDANVIAEEGDEGATVCTVEQDQATQAFIDYVSENFAG